MALEAGDGGTLEREGTGACGKGDGPCEAGALLKEDASPRDDEGALSGVHRLRELSRVPPGARHSKWSNMLIHGDNLRALEALTAQMKRGRIKNADNTDGVRLIYIDPPFASGQSYRDAKGRLAYGDKRKGDDFIGFISARLTLLRELLSEDGSIYLHLDWRMAHYLKVIMDEVFGAENFLNEIIWSYGGRGAKSVARQFSRNHDTILLYRKKDHIFNPVVVEKKIPRSSGGYRLDENGRWFKTAPRGDYTDKSIERLEKEGRIYRTRTGSIRIKYFLREEKGFLIEEKRVGDVWDDIPDAMHMGVEEKTGYPTQKPEALLRRIICASSGPGDIVLDAFAGSGTACLAAQKERRRWIGIDSGALSLETIKSRLERSFFSCAKARRSGEDSFAGVITPYTLFHVD